VPSARERVVVVSVFAVSKPGAERAAGRRGAREVDPKIWEFVGRTAEHALRLELGCPCTPAVRGPASSRTRPSCPSPRNGAAIGGEVLDLQAEVVAERQLERLLRGRSPGAAGPSKVGSWIPAGAGFAVGRAPGRVREEQRTGGRWGSRSHRGSAPSQHGGEG
jgi:hypothetical protein